MSEKTKFWLLLALLVLSMALVVVLNTSANHVLLGR
jgi:hypothetical protein